MDRDIIMKVLEVVVMLAVIIITKYVIPYLKAKTDNEQFSKIMQIACESVKAAEQIYGKTHKISKKKYATRSLIKMMQRAGINMNEQEIDMLVEAAVHAMNTEAAFVGARPNTIMEAKESFKYTDSDTDKSTDEPK